uniref:TIR domain-containing protein n=1 Tax=Anguilla anguilla TaxID=7936 RepID=A0A0E9X156_ANGAN
MSHGFSRNFCPSWRTNRVGNSAYTIGTLSQVKPILDNLVDSIYSSRKTICLISRHYLESEWCSREIQVASFRLFDEKKDVLVLVFLEKIPHNQLPPTTG